MEQSKVDYYYKVIKESGEFDVEFYFKRYPDAEFDDIDPIIHYITIGAKMMYNPSKKFNTYYYINKYADIHSHLIDVGFENFNPLVHYILHGKDEGRIPFFSNDLLGADEDLFARNNDLLVTKFVLAYEKSQKSQQYYENKLNSLELLIELIFSNLDIKPKGNFRYKQLLNLEILKLYDKICQKYGLNYWLDGETLLGAIKYEGFIPWEKNISVGMLRNDFTKLMHLIKEEFMELSIDNMLNIKYHEFDENWNLKNYLDNNYPFLYAKILLVNVNIQFNIFIYDYVGENNLQFYEDTKNEFISSIFKNDLSPKESISKYNKKLNIKEGESEWIINSLDSDSKINIFNSSDIFELGKINFEDNIFNCPINLDKYLTTVYGNDFFNISHNMHDLQNSLLVNYFNSDNREQLSLKYLLFKLKDSVDKFS